MATTATRRATRATRWAAPSGPTCRPPSCTRTRSAAAKAWSRPTARSSSGPASTPAARPRTSSSSTSPERRPKIWWGPVNRPISRGALRPAPGPARRATVAGRDLYSQDCFIGAAPAHRRSLRVYTETAWASIFARNLFRRPTAGAAGRLRPRTSRSSASRRSRPTPRPRAPARGPRSWSISSGWRSSSSAPSTPARSRRARSRS